MGTGGFFGIGALPLHEVNRRAMVEGVRGVGVAQPVGTHGGCYASLLGCLAHDHADAPAVQELPTPGGENRLLCARRAAQAGQFRPHRALVT